MKKTLFILVTSLTSAFAMAQDIYQVGELSTTDLNGTARYVGMGGAMGALGGDLSVMSSSPAAIGLYRRNDLAVTASLSVCLEARSLMTKATPMYPSISWALFIHGI